MSLIGLKPGDSTVEGFLSVILGPMFSGKTSELISIYKLNKIAQIRTLVVNYIEDTRYDEHKLSSHDEVMIPCTRLEKLYPVIGLRDEFDASSSTKGSSSTTCMMLWYLCFPSGRLYMFVA